MVNEPPDVHTNISRTMNELILKYSAIPPQTPAKILSLFDLHNILYILFPEILSEKYNFVNYFKS